MLTLYDEAAQPGSCSDAMMMVLQFLVTQAHPPKGHDDSGGVFDKRWWNIKKFEIGVDKCVVYLEHYEWDTGETTQHKATFGAEMMNFEDIKD